MESKECTGCGEEKPLDEYYKQNKGKFGRAAECILCISVKKREKYRLKKFGWWDVREKEIRRVA
jgi:hypothetical protein